MAKCDLLLILLLYSNFELTVKTIFWVSSSYDMEVPHSSRPCSMVKYPGDELVSPHPSLASEPTNAS